jgi:ComF family protein
MKFLKNIISSLDHLIFPHNCLGCATDILTKDALLCAKCFNYLPQTYFFERANNAVEKKFYGRLPIASAGASYYFNKNSVIQNLVFQLKYKNNKEAGIYLGKLVGYHILKSQRFNSIDALVPLPLNPKREFTRGYNQAMLICQGIAQVWQKPVLKDVVARKVFTETQTHENLINRWTNMEGVFAITQPSLLTNQHVLLVDDVVTTGSTLESCGAEILKIPNTKLSIACAAYTS